MGELFGTDGIRGIANRYPITPELMLQLGKAIGHVLRAKAPADRHGLAHRRVIIGKDTRLSGYMLETALTSGLVSTGMEVFLVGPVPTPAVAHLTTSMCGAAGIMLTASHNPFDDNGVKIFGEEGFKLPDALEAEIEEAVLRGDFTGDDVRSDNLGKAHRVEDARGRYIEYAKSAVREMQLKRLKIVLDCANGASYFIAPLIFRELGAEVVKAYAEPDGFNINNGCGALHPETVGQLVREHGADVGIAFDGDADRVMFCDADANVVDGDRIMAMCAIAWKNEGRLAKDTLVTTPMSNLGLHEAMAKNGIHVVTAGVGDRYVIERMREGGFNLGGEKSGHLILMDYATTGDGIICALHVLRLMLQTGKPLSELAKCMTEHPHKLVNLPVPNKDTPIDDMLALQAAMREFDNELVPPEGRRLIRYSGTEMKLRIYVEGREAEAVDRWVDRFSDAVREDLGA